MKATMLVAVLVGFIGLISGCAVAKTYLVRTPTASAKLVQKWRVDEFASEVEENERKRALDFFDPSRSSVFPSFFLPFGAKALKELQSVAQPSDSVAWYSDHWMNLDIDYICLERDGKRVWIHKMVEQRPETLANHTAEPSSPSLGGSS